MNSKNKGDLAVSKAITYFVGKQEEVLLPFGNRRPYDLVIERENRLLKVQCKYTTCKSPYGIYTVPLRVMGGNQSYHTAKLYKKDDFDLLFVYTGSGDMYEIPTEVWSRNRSYLSLGKKLQKWKIL